MGRGPTGTVRGIPEEEVTNVLYQLVERLYNESSTFERKRAREILLDMGISEDDVDGFLFSFMRTVPGITNVEYGKYHITPHWDVATKHRLFRFTPGKLDILAAMQLRDILELEKASPDGLSPDIEALLEDLNAKIGDKAS